MKAFESILLKPYKLFEWLIGYPLSRFLSGRGKTAAEEILTLPNFISLLRIPLGAGMWYFADKSVAISGMMFGAAMMSDLVDGVMARILGPTKFGEILDPTCDKIFFAFCVMAYRPSFTHWIFYTILLVELFILLAPLLLLKLKQLKASEADLRSNIYGKTKFTLECAALGLVVAGREMLGNFCLALAIPFAVWSIIKKLQDSKMWS